MRVLLAILLVCSFNFFIITNVFAKTSYDTGDTLLKEERIKKKEEALKKPMSSFTIPGEEIFNIKIAKNKTFRLWQIEVEGNTVLSKDEIDKIIYDYKWTTISLKEVKELVDKLKQAYDKKGYITTKILVPKQNILKTKKLILNIKEGFIEELYYGDNTVLDKIKLFLAFPSGRKSVLNVWQLDQGMDNLNRLPSNNVSVAMLPGESEGGTKVFLRNRPKDEFRGKIGYDNAGQASTGKNRAKVTLEKDNLLGINDMFTFYHISSKDTNAEAFQYSVPFRDWLFTYDWAYSEYLSSVDSASDMFGKIKNYSITAYKTLFRDNKNKVGAKLIYNHKNSMRFLNDFELNPQPLSIMRTGLDYEHRGDGDVFYTDVTYSKGIGRNSTIDEPDISYDEPHAQFEKIDGSMTYMKRLTEKLSYKAEIRGQYSFQSLYSSEQIYLGSADTVRGFMDSPSVGDSGVYLRNEISTTLGRTNFQPYIFADAGMNYVKAKRTNEYLSGTGFGIRYISKDVNFDISYGIPLYRSDSIEKNEGEIYASCTIKLF